MLKLIKKMNKTNILLNNIITLKQLQAPKAVMTVQNQVLNDVSPIEIKNRITFFDVKFLVAKFRECRFLFEDL
jgi:hypothetical protein